MTYRHLSRKANDRTRYRHGCGDTWDAVPVQIQACIMALTGRGIESDVRISDATSEPITYYDTYTGKKVGETDALNRITSQFLDS
jgi:hypothetical protein